MEFVLGKVRFPNAMSGILSGGILAFARGRGRIWGDCYDCRKYSRRDKNPSACGLFLAVAAGNMDEAYRYVGILVVISFLVRTGMNAVTRGFQKYNRRPVTDDGRTESRVFRKQLKNFPLQIEFYGGRRDALKLGASGCGKSMTLKVIAGIEIPDTGNIQSGGRVLFDSENQINLPPRKRRLRIFVSELCLVPQYDSASEY